MGSGAAVAAIALTGCGGGGGQAGTRLTGAALARQRSSDATRIARTTLAVTGFGIRISRAAATGVSAILGNRLPVLLLALRIGRTPTQGQDPDTGLYYRVTINPDGSGRQDLFTDAAYTSSAGYFAWGAPRWANGVTGAYPAIIDSSFLISAGQFAGSQGTLEVTVQDASAQNDVLHVVLTDALSDHVTGVFRITSGKLVGTSTAACGDGDAFATSEAYPNTDGPVVVTDTWPDGSTGTTDANADGTGNTTYTDVTGDVSATGDYTDTGVDTIDYSSGGSDTVDTNTGQDVSGSDTGDTGDPSDGGATMAVPRRAAPHPARPFRRSERARGIA